MLGLGGVIPPRVWNWVFALSQVSFILPIVLCPQKPVAPGKSVNRVCTEENMSFFCLSVH